ncbi:MAG: hypothetical protein CVV44_02550 [Spirochaetae bacterium HGW-Spirochaetae-1]|jgi:uncharacterized protein (TIGR00159 family)|nr:MAG: hypothetical protein CVV44_02550 [Spirochaetae bacterium HGW-Spirochaetae-1]
MHILSQYINIIISFIDWRTFFDVPIMALMVLILYRTLKSSGSWRIGMGIGVILFIYSMARLFSFSGLSWLFNNVSNIALIALIIIFQPEIRKIFERTASTLKIRKTLSEGNHLSLLICESVFQMAAGKLGAIIILPGRDSINSKVSGGIHMNGRPSVPLILSIFDNHSPGHDGAMVIENGEITTFGLRLPLSTSTRYNNEFGTRHHASLGLSEATDALIITVSEERGVISLFHEGQVELVENEKELQDRIEEHWKTAGGFTPLQQTQGKKMSLVLEGALSLLLAFILWLSIMATVSQTKELVTTIPIEYRLADKMIISGDKPIIARIKISGPASEINLVRPEELKATVDLKQSKPGKVTISVARNIINLHHNINLIDAQPSNFDVDLYSFVQQDVIIKPQLVGALPAGLDILSVEVTPEKLQVMLATEKNSNEEIYLTTTPIFLQNISQNTTIRCKVIAPPEIISLEAKPLPDVSVTIIIKKRGVK